MEKKVLLTELVDRGSHLRKEITPTAVVTDEGKHAAGTFWDANKTINEIVAGASSAQDTLKEVEDKLNKEIQDARAAEQAISDRIDDVLGIDALDIENLKTALEDIDADTGILSVINNKTDKVDSATSGNFAALDANGNLTDSGHKHSDYITQHQDLSNYVQKSQTTGLLKNNGTVDTNTYLTLHLDISGKANITDISVITDNTNGHEYVDFGLPSGTLWATVNIGASSETGYGNYYKYGKGSEQYSRTQPNYTGTENPLAESADTATQVWGGGWHTPTNAQFQELMSYCTWTWGAKNNINGYTVSRNSKSIFLPAGGNYYQGGIYTDGLLGMYWTSTPVNEQSATCATLDSSYKTTNPLTRDDGLTVRAVLNSATTSVLGKTATDEEKAAWNDKVSKSQTSGLLKNDGTVDTNVYLTEHQSLTDYIQKNQTAGLIKNDGTIDTNTYLTQHQDISGKVNISDIAASIVDNTNEHEYVDLGLPSGLCWATVNVGASSESDTGLYFQWADTQGYTASLVGTGNGKKAFKWEDYKYGNGSSNPSANEMTKYQGTASGKDGLTIIESTDDAAQAAWGGNWRIPTKEEFLELIDNTDNEVVTINNISGRKFINKTDSSKYIFLPVTGYVEDSTIYNFYGLYWTSSLGTLSDRNAKTATYFLISSTLANYFIYWRSLGNVIRPVISQPVSITLGKAVTTEEKTAWNAKLDSSALTNYVLKSSTSGLIKNDGTIDTNTYLTQHLDISGKLDSSYLTEHIDDTNEVEYVDLGLPSGKVWAKYNIGASSEADYGTAFQWGATSTYSGTDNYYTTSMADGEALPITNDTARQILGGNWRMPTKAEWGELFDNTTLTSYYQYTDNTYTTIIYGIQFLSKINESVLKIPCHYYNSSTGQFDNTNNLLYYPTVLAGSSNNPGVVKFNSGSASLWTDLYLTRTLLFNIRAIADQGIVDRSRYIPYSEKGVNNGVATLDSTGKLEDLQIPNKYYNIQTGYYYNGDFYSLNPYSSSGAPIPDSTKIITPSSDKLYLDWHSRNIYYYSVNAYSLIKGTGGNIGTDTDLSFINHPDPYYAYIINVTNDLNASSLGASYNFTNGHAIRVIFTASSQKTVTINHNATYSICPDATDLTLTIPAGGFREVTIMKANDKIYVIPNKY